MDIKKGIFSIFMASALGIIMNPDALAISNNIRIKVLDTSAIVKTVPRTTEVAGEKTALQEVQEIAVSNVDETPEASDGPFLAEIYQPYIEPYVPENYIDIAGHVLEVVSVSSTGVDSGSHVNKYGEHFYWGHNTSGVFRGLYDMGIGSTFEMSEGGVVRKYLVMREAVIFEKNQATGQLQLNGSGNYMVPLINGHFDRADYDAVLMTCYGTMLGGGDATHRYVLFAKAMDLQ